jgi:hypothetical protein
MKEDSKHLISQSLKGRKVTEETKKKISKSNSRKSKNMPPNYAEIISKAKKGKPNPKLSKSRKGKPHPKKSWKVDQFSLNSEYIKTFNSSREAGEFLNKNPQSIRDAASGIQKTAYGFKWEYRD